MKKFCLMLTLLVAVLMGGCRKDRGADVEGLFRCVPNTASYVVVADLRSIIEKSGSKINGDKVEASAELQKALEQAQDKKAADTFKALLNGDSGIEPSAAVAFADGFSNYIIGNLSSTSKFREFVTKNDGGEWKEQDGIEYSGVYAITENRFWLRAGGQQVNPDKIKEYLALSERQSFAGSDFAPMLKDADRDMVGWCDINGAMNTAGVGFQQRAMVKMVSEAMFKDAGFAVFDMQFDKGAVSMECRLLDSNGKDAKYLLPSQKIDEKVLSRLGGKADGLLAVAVPQKLIKQIKGMVSGKISMVGMVVNAMGCIDGTSAFAFTNHGDGLNGVIQTNGESTADLMSMLQGMGMTVSKENKELLVSQGSLDGTDDVAAMAMLLKGCSMGVVANANTFNPTFAPNANGIKDMVVKMVPKSGSMVLEIQIRAKNPDVNFIVSMLGA